jgi:hypothetical protein
MNLLYTLLFTNLNAVLSGTQTVKIISNLGTRENSVYLDLGKFGASQTHRNIAGTSGIPWYNSEHSELPLIHKLNSSADAEGMSPRYEHALRYQYPRSEQLLNSTIKFAA